VITISCNEKQKQSGHFKSKDGKLLTKENEIIRKYRKDPPTPADTDNFRTEKLSTNHRRGEDGTETTYDIPETNIILKTKI
jgi:hypothetical protein